MRERRGEDAAGGGTEACAQFASCGETAGVAPRLLNELILERARQKDSTFRDFLTLFDHRLISLFYRAWEKYRAPIGYEHARTRDEGLDAVSTCLFDLVGMGTAGLRGRFHAPADERLPYYA